jgi:hypothetical protein
MSAEDKLKAMGLTLPAPPKPSANYVSFKKSAISSFGPACTHRTEPARG